MTTEGAYDLMSQVLDARVTDLEIGAFAIAMRIKGETVAELTGFLAAAHERCIAIGGGQAGVPTAAGSYAQPTVVLPSYNGSRRIANLTPLLACLLARQGVHVLVHGPLNDAVRVTSADIFAALALPFADNAAAIESAWARDEPAFMRTEALCPPLARLLAVRDVVGLRNPAHTIAKLLSIGNAAGSGGFRIVNYTHPEYGARLAEFMTATGADAMLMRGTEGEPVADARRLQKLDVYIGGALRADLSMSGQSGVTTQLAALPDRDARATAAWTRSVVDGEQPVPAVLAAQVECLMRAIGAIGVVDGAAPAPLTPA